MTAQFKRILFPLQGPRMLTNSFWPVHIMSAAVDGYSERFFLVRPDWKKVKVCN